MAPAEDADITPFGMSCAHTTWLLSRARKLPETALEVGLASRRQWSDLSGRTRRLLAITAAAEGILKLTALIDLKRRPASQVRGPKWVWATVVTVVGSGGVVPISYFLLGGDSLDRSPTDLRDSRR